MRSDRVFDLADPADRRKLRRQILRSGDLSSPSLTLLLRLETQSQDDAAYWDTVAELARELHREFGFRSAPARPVSGSDDTRPRQQGRDSRRWEAAGRNRRWVQAPGSLPGRDQPVRDDGPYLIHSRRDEPGPRLARRPTSVGADVAAMGLPVPDAQHHAPHPGTFRRTPHLDVDDAGPIPVGMRFTATVYVDDLPSAPGEEGPELELPADDEVRLDLTLTMSDHFVAVGPVVGTIVVRPDAQRSTACEFTVECVGTVGGPPGLAVAFMHGWRPAGRVLRNLEVSGAPVDPDRTSAEATAVVVDPDATAPDLLVRITPTPGDDERNFDVTVASPHLPEFVHGVNVPWRLPHATKHLVAGYMDAFTTTTPGGRKAALLGAGRDLFSATPREFQEAYWRLADREPGLRTIFVATSEPHIPWELMVPHDDDRVEAPLGVAHSVGRWIDPHEHAAPEQTVPLSSARVIAPRYRGGKRLTFADDEANRVIGVIGGERIQPARLRTIDAALGRQGASLLHFVCHGEDASHGQVIALDPNDELREVQLAGLEGVADAVREWRPFVFLNACQVGRSAPALVGTGGFAARFLRLGARCVIAPIWSVKDATAAAVAQEFYERLQTDPSIPFATILADIRRKAYEGDDPEDSFAAYCFYGDPSAAIAASEKAAH